MADSFLLDPARYGPQIGRLLRPRLAELGPGSLDQAMAEQLHALQPADLFPHAPVVDASLAACCLAALWLWYDGLDESHCLSQAIETRQGSYWHAIMHRREGDFGNSKYWYRRVGSHALWKPLGQYARTTLQAAPQGTVPPHDWPLNASGSWDPYRFVDWSEQLVGTGSPAELVCRELAQAEWIGLFEDCYAGAIGSSR